ncbi:MAG: hypothetical protein MUO38_14040 [Anaerolineales bacterium]|nr:hypothetical protein [Anaerolineales bacterium]
MSEQIREILGECERARIAEKVEARTEALEQALDDSTSLLRTIRDEDDGGAIAAQVVDNCAALAGKDETDA